MANSDAYACDLAMIRRIIRRDQREAAERIAAKKRAISSTCSIDDSPGSQDVNYGPRSIKRLRLDHETAPLVPPRPQPKLRMRKVNKQPSDSSLTTEVAVPDGTPFPSRTLDTLASLRIRVKALEGEVRRERAEREAGAAAHRAERGKAREDRRALVRKLQKALEAFEGLKEKYDGLRSQVWERQKEILDKLGRSFEQVDVDGQKQKTRLNQVMRKLEAVQTYLETDGVSTTAHSQRASTIPTPPSSAPSSQQSQSASAGPYREPRSKRLRANNTKYAYSGSGPVDSAASMDASSTDVDEEQPTGKGGPGDMSRTQLIDINDFVNDDGEYTTSVEQVLQTESPSAVLRRPVTFNELQDRQFSMSRRSDVPGSSYGPFYDPVSSFEAIDCKMDLTVDELREHHIDSLQNVPAFVGGGEGTGGYVVTRD
jgi:DNA-binding protein H-NS